MFRSAVNVNDAGDTLSGGAYPAIGPEVRNQPATTAPPAASGSPSDWDINHIEKSADDEDTAPKSLCADPATERGEAQQTGPSTAIHRRRACGQCGQLRSDRREGAVVQVAVGRSKADRPRAVQGGCGQAVVGRRMSEAKTGAKRQAVHRLSIDSGSHGTVRSLLIHHYDSPPPPPDDRAPRRA